MLKFEEIWTDSPRESTEKWKTNDEFCEQPYDFKVLQCEFSGGFKFDDYDCMFTISRPATV